MPGYPPIFSQNAAPRPEFWPWCLDVWDIRRPLRELLLFPAPSGAWGGGGGTHWDQTFATLVPPKGRLRSGPEGWVEEEQSTNHQSRSVGQCGLSERVSVQKSQSTASSLVLMHRARQDRGAWHRLTTVLLRTRIPQAWQWVLGLQLAAPRREARGWSPPLRTPERASRVRWARRRLPQRPAAWPESALMPNVHLSVGGGACCRLGTVGWRRLGVASWIGAAP